MDTLQKAAWKKAHPWANVRDDGDTAGLTAFGRTAAAVLKKTSDPLAREAVNKALLNAVAQSIGGRRDMPSLRLLSEAAKAIHAAVPAERPVGSMATLRDSGVAVTIINGGGGFYAIKFPDGSAGIVGEAAFTPENVAEAMQPKGASGGSLRKSASSSPIGSRIRALKDGSVGVVTASNHDSVVATFAYGSLRVLKHDAYESA
jgi:hypothetical protein